MTNTPPPFDPNTNPKAAAKAAKAYAKATRPWFKKKRFIIPIALVALAVISPALGGEDDETAAQESKSDTSAASTPAAQEQKPAADKKKAPAPKPKWKTVAKISGSADKQSDTIKLTGGKVRVVYDFKDTSGMDMIVGAIYVLDEGTDLMEEGGFPEVTVSESGKGETILRKGSGEYYVKVTAANAEYTVTLQEMK
ncbi:hypothetical protein [Aeromicrobium sp.]|uniref:hypothetical protein n=1 Tax=Aeromicrobium sp. TaxID=1871063 RepID=UPI0028AA0F58|nr:hypothetical protein [Aeromicrobium sp.]